MACSSRPFEVLLARMKIILEVLIAEAALEDIK